MALRETPGGLMLTVRATPKAARNQIAGLRNDAVLVKVTAAPDKGKANGAIIALLADAIGILRSAIELVSGATDRNKVMRIASHDEAVQKWFGGLTRE